MAETVNIRLKPTVLHRAMLIDAQLERAHLFASFMADRGCQVTATAKSVSEALTQRGDVPDKEDDISLLVLYATDLSAKDVKDIGELTSAIDKPLLVITESSDPQVVANAIAAGASFCQPLGVNADRLQSGVVGAIEVHKRLHSLQKERDQAVQGLSERKLIDRAKAIVMESRTLSEPDAFAYMQKLSMSRNTPLAEIARSIIAAKDLLG
ncbi:MAG: ANTAR domain-containing protein [Roseibium sp.]|uniref:ANTAR domain-containing response regulator n=1 Tax=Roseibium sp. TaxID=1936156 RepID=UPI003D9C6587